MTERWQRYGRLIAHLERFVCWPGIVAGETAGDTLAGTTGTWAARAASRFALCFASRLSCRAVCSAARRSACRTFVAKNLLTAALSAHSAIRGALTPLAPWQVKLSSQSSLCCARACFTKGLMATSTFIALSRGVWTHARLEDKRQFSLESKHHLRLLPDETFEFVVNSIIPSIN
jgi:hypothetical protein